MKKVVLASLLACAAIASGLPSAYAQQPVALGTGAAAAAAPCALPDAEYKAYTDAIGQTDPKAKAAAIEAYLTAFPQSACPANKPDTLAILMMAYVASNDSAKTIDAADRVLQLDPNNLRALTFETYMRKASATAANPADNQAALDAAAGFAQKGLVAPKPAAMSDADFKTLQANAFPVFYSAIGTAALNKKDTATAIDAFKKELAAVSLAQTQAPGPYLQDTYYLALAYLQSTPSDPLDCAFYAARFVGYAPEPFKTQITPTAKSCYRKYHGKDDGFDALVTLAKANLNPPADLASSITPAPTPAEQIHTIITTTPDLKTLAISDKEMVFQYGSPEDAGKVWDTIKGTSTQLPDVLVVDASTPNVLKVAVSDDAKPTKTADFTFNLATPEAPVEPEKPSAKATPAQLAAYKTKLAAYNKAVADAKKKADAVAALTTVGSTVTLQGTYDSFTPNPVMITMKDGEVILPKATKPAPKAAAPVHHTAAAAAHK